MGSSLCLSCYVGYVTVFKRGHACSANHCGSLIPVTKKKKGGKILMGPIASWFRVSVGSHNVMDG